MTRLKQAKEEAETEVAEHKTSTEQLARPTGRICCGIVPGCPVQAESDPCVLSEGLAQAVIALYSKQIKIKKKKSPQFSSHFFFCS
jgi:hypothetical protein